ncbi:MAG: CopG family transcriptional regulator [Acidobacteria bacterium]|nr:CopG family transcriptional regulator [Acidobacteriota bacterium]
MKKIISKKNLPSAESIARRADGGEDVSRFFTNRGKMMQPIQRVNVDLTVSMLRELDAAAAELNISRQAVIKTFIRQVLDQRLLANHARRSA